MGVNYWVDLKFDLHGDNKNQHGQQVNIFQNQWPPSIKESLDSSQLEAVKLMLTNGIALVQGPPGTGKTFCGALAVRVLLRNQLIWDRGRSPILIVCYTNHALDQFLNHILTFVEKSNVVRIGGRCKDPNLQDCLLRRDKQNKISFNWAEYLTLKSQLQGKLRKINQPDKRVDYRIGLLYCPELVEKIISDFIRTYQVISQKRELSVSSKQKIFDLWVESNVTTKKFFKELVDCEMLCGNTLKYNEPRAEGVQLLRRNDAVRDTFKVNREQFEKYQQDLETEMFEGEDEALNSDEENNRDVDEYDLKEEMEQDEIEFKNVLENAYENNQNTERIFDFDEEYIEELLDEATYHKNTWQLNQDDRTQLRNYIFSQKYKNESLYGFEQDYKIYKEMQKQLQNKYKQQDLLIMRSKQIVGATVTGCAKYADMLTHLNCRIMIIEEAAEVLESHVVAIITTNVQHLILIGDHQQLRPKLESYYLEQKYQTNISLFERMVMSGLKLVTLENQRRMKTKFADIIRLIYGNRYQDDQCIQMKNMVPAIGLRDDLLFFDHRVFESTSANQSSKSNQFEAEMIKNQIKYLLQNNYQPQQITALALYVHQALIIKKKLAELRIIGVNVQTVDNYQGEENDIIIVSLVRSNPQNKIGFVGIENRICVALSRARIGLYVYGNFDCIQRYVKQEKKLELWLKILGLAKEKNFLKNEIVLQCQSHKNQTIVRNIEDWSSSPNGGCQLDCNIRFNCGHVCKQKCHSLEHIKQNCLENCQVMLECGHKCDSLCRKVPCPPCNQPVVKQLECGHIQDGPCHVDAKTIKCISRCKKILPCGHQCQLKCSDQCNIFQCFELVFQQFTEQFFFIKQIQLDLTCGHNKSIECYLAGKVVVCDEPCMQTLECGHKCKGSCSKCFDYTLHMPCKEPCKRILHCNHEFQKQFQSHFFRCSNVCGQPCVRCPKKCEYKCCQAICSSKCGEVCPPCLGLCPYKCKHSKCQRMCYEPCNRAPCKVPCEKKLSCGCQCLGLCGEVCPNLCRNDDHDNDKEPFEIMFGNEDDPDAQFYQLECPGKHIFEVKGLDQYFYGESEKIEKVGGIMKFLKCPRCSQTISKSARYNKYIKQVFQNLNKIKQAQNKQVEVSQVELMQAIQLVRTIYQNPKNFQQDISQLLMSQLKRVQNQQQCELMKPQFNCIMNQLKYFNIAIQIKNSSLMMKKKQFMGQINSLYDNYLINADFYILSTDKFWQQLQYKIQSIQLFIEFDKRIDLQKFQPMPNTSALEQNIQIKIFNKLQNTKLTLGQEDNEYCKKILAQFSGVSRAEQIEIAKALKEIGPGHWYKCPNGHYFAIGECGGAMELAKCADCGAAIGGNNHALVQGNQHTGDLDNSSHAAFSQEANDALIRRLRQQYE